MFPAHALADAPFAQELCALLESGCDATCFVSDAALRPGQDLIAAAEDGFSADVLVLILSRASTPPSWRRERWEPLLFGRAMELSTSVAICLLEECAFPPLLRRRLKFFDARGDRLAAMRGLKRWLRGIQFKVDPRMEISAELGPLYSALADRAGRCTASGSMAERFAGEAAPDFDGVFWVPAHGRTLAQISGDLGVQLRMALDGPLPENCRRIRDLLSGKRCLLILDAPDIDIEALIPCGLASVLCTTDPVRIVNETPSLPAARTLVLARRFAEAYEMLYVLLSRDVDQEFCARQLIWICEHWDRLDEANRLRCYSVPGPMEQLRLF